MKRKRGNSVMCLKVCVEGWLLLCMWKEAFKWMCEHFIFYYIYMFYVRHWVPWVTVKGKYYVRTGPGKYS